MAAAWIRPLECGARGVRVDSTGVGVKGREEPGRR